QHEEHVSLLNAALAASNQFTEESSEAVQHLAESYAAASVAADSELLPGMTRLITIGGLTTDQLDRATQATLNLSAVTGKTVPEAFELMAKAAEGNYTAF